MNKRKKLLAVLAALLTATALWAAGPFKFNGDVVLDDGSGDSPKLRLIDGSDEEHWLYIDSGDLNIATNQASDQTLRLDNEGAGGFHLSVGQGTISASDLVMSLTGFRIGVTGPCISKLTSFFYHDDNCDHDQDTGEDDLSIDDDTADSDSEVPDNITTTRTKCINVDPSHTTTDWLFFRTDAALTLTGIDCIVDASTSVVMTLRECNADAASCGNSEAAITCGTTNSTEASGIDDASVDAGDWLRVTVGTVTGSPTQADLCVNYTSAS